MTPSLRYRPGSAVAVVSGRTAVLLDLDPQDPLITRIVTLLDEGGGIDDILDALVSTGLKTLADFGAFRVSDEGVRMVVRGRVGGSVGAHSDLHAEHTMWFDTWQPGVAAAALGLPTESASEPLVIGQGVVLASAVFVESTAILESPAPVPPSAAVAAVAATELPISPEPAAVVDPGSSVEPTPEANAVPQTVSPAESEPDPALEISSEVDPGATIDAPLTISGEQLLAVSSPAAAEPPALITGMPWAVDEPESEPGDEPLAAPEPLPVPDPVAVPVPAPEPVAPPRPVSQPAATYTAAPIPGSTPGPVGSPAITPVRTSPSSSGPAPIPSPVAEPEPAPALVAHPSLAGLVRSTPSPGAEISADRTINRASLVGLPAVVMVVAARCSEGHLSPAYAGSCRVCRGSIPQQHPIEIPRPTLGQLRLSTGGVVSLDRPAILGRNPRVPQGYVGEQPNLVRLSDPDKDVSGQHLEVSLDYWNVLVCDLGSTNGTEVILPGEMPVVLRPNDPVIIEPGTRVVMAGSISFLFEVLP